MISQKIKKTSALILLSLCLLGTFLPIAFSSGRLVYFHIYLFRQNRRLYVLVDGQIDSNTRRLRYVFIKVYINGQLKAYHRTRVDGSEHFRTCVGVRRVPRRAYVTVVIQPSGMKPVIRTYLMDGIRFVRVATSFMG